MQQLKPKYNLLTAICLVVGIVVGTGIFFKAGDVLKEVNGNLSLSIIAWLIGGAIMLISSYNFANISIAYGNVHSMTDYARVSISRKYGFIVGVFAKYIYFPSMTSTVSFVVGMYFCQTLDLTQGAFPFSGYVFLFAFLFLTILVVLNIFGPIIAAKLQISTTLVKMVPLLLMGIVGIIAGITNGTLSSNFDYVGSSTASGSGLLGAVCVTAFSYEGWICATNIGGEIKNRSKNLPLALIIGSIIVIGIYILYNIGISGAIKTGAILDGASASESVRIAFANLFGTTFANILIIIVVISAIGTLNGLVIANSRSAYALAINEQGLFQEQMTKVTVKHNVPITSSIFGYIITICWLAYYYFSQTNSKANGIGFPFDSSELPIITTYFLYIPMFIAFMVKKENNIFKRFVMPTLGVIAASFMIFAACYRHKITTVYYLIFFTVVIIIALIVEQLRLKKSKLKE